MSNIVLIGTTIAVVALGAGFWFYTNMDPAAYLSATNTERAFSGGTFPELLGNGQSLECTFDLRDGGNVSTGTLYLADGGERMRGDFNFVRSGPGSMVVHMIRTDGYNYLWGTYFPQGVKTKVTDQNRENILESLGMNDVDNDAYTCAPWSVDASLFVPPSELSFMDNASITNLGQKAIKTGTEGDIPADVKSFQCASCDNVSGIVREQCRQALKCN